VAPKSFSQCFGVDYIRARAQTGAVVGYVLLYLLNAVKIFFGYGLAGIYYFGKQNLVLSMVALYLHIALILKSF
jgi:hypothetical protein